MKYTKKIAILAAGVFYFLCGSAQIYSTLNVSRVDGLSDSNVKAICTDQLGFVWFGTEHGLNRYDGFETIKYYNSLNDSNSVLSNDIYRLYSDKVGNLWIVTSRGLNRYLRNSESFEKVALDQQVENVSCFYEDEEYVWLLSRSSKVSLYHKVNGTIHTEPIKYLGEDKFNSSFSIQYVREYKNDQLLVAISNQGLYLFDKKSKTLQLYFKLPVYNYTGLEIVGEDVLAASKFSGIYRVSNGNKLLVHTKGNSELKNNIILDLKKSPVSSNIWVATDGDGVQEFDQDLNLISNYIAGPMANQPLPDNAIQFIDFKEDGKIWLGTVRSGAVLLYPDMFDHIPYVNNYIAGPSNKVVLRIVEDGEGIIWLGTDGGGINRFDPDTYEFRNYKKWGTGKITGMARYSKDVLLCSMYSDRLYFFNTKTGEYSDAHLHPLFSDIPLKTTYRIYRDTKNNIWIAGNGLRKINPENNSKKVFPNPENNGVFSQVSPLFYTVSEDTIAGKLWFASNNGIYCYAYNSGKIIVPVVLNNLRRSFGNSVYSIVVDKEGNLIFGTTKGLYLYNTESELVSRYFEEGAFENTIFNTLFYGNGSLWAATSDGLLNITGRNSQKDITYYQVGNHVYRSGAFQYSTDGKFNLGTNNGFLRFLPEQVESDTVASKVEFTSFIQSGTKKGQELSVNLLKDRNNQIRIPFSNSVFRLTFNSLDIPFQDKISYSYLLEGFEEVWHTTKSREATYTNLTPGKYIFKVKASTVTGGWNEQTYDLSFEVLPPWYQKLWFRLSVIVFLLAIAGLIWNELLKRAKLQHLVLLEKKEKERLEEINQMKLRFFTNISHELRTPLTLIYSPLKKMARGKASADEIKNGLPGLYRNANRMKILVDQILEFRKSEMDELRLNIENSDLIDLCREAIESFHFMSKTEEISMKLIHNQDQLFCDFDRDKFTKILYNLLSNAFKHTPKNGVVEIAVESSDENIKIKVTDTGQGIEESELESIFDRYYQTSAQVEGTGIGLALTKKLVELHDGKIWAENTSGKGATFIVEFPCLKGEIKEKKVESMVTDDTDTPRLTDEKVQHDARGLQLSLLIVEDDWELRQFLHSEFQNEFQVFTASNGKEGLDKCIEHLPDVVITDVMMPEMNGYEFCMALREDLRVSHIPVIMLTAKAMAENQIEGYKSGADLYIPKPFDKEILETQIHALLKNRAILKKRFGHDLGMDAKAMTSSTKDEKLLHKAISIVEMNLQNNQFDVNGFVDELGISRTLAYKKIKAISGKSINDFILSVRLKRAGAMLKSTEKSVSEIAIETGFADHSYFSAVFKKNFEVSPSEFRQKGES